ncbi:polyhydroxyalkanoate synthase [Paucimonas lemoignei]|uniref:Polyhydroxyalkanoate synthase n=1 Tax=Paucimonas lemoignei TaxID=29443 RepID=A0A4R3I090_PAULE|nr:class I poly(R)-hydroxyalkanoic acid synthase [Paucimonas lemoignei]TCS39096.1 polyhydroxyalkanoate synthase [Paucimonas lemoignei]
MNIPLPLHPTMWMTQIADPGAFQDLFKAAQPGFDAFALKLGDAEVKLDPVVVAQLQGDYLKQFTSLWQELASDKTPALEDNRFSSGEWQSNKLHAFTAAAYLLNSRFLQSMADAVQAPPKIKQRIQFAVQQTIDAMSPANFFATNPEVHKKILETKGESLTKGINHLLADMRKGRISQSDESAFEVGKNLAITEGAVVFENELFQLIQYRPQTATVYQKPLLLVPPCINKFYILDLQPQNSVVKHLVELGHTVFMVSWRNPDASMAKTTWDDYVEQGVIKAVHLTQEVSGQKQINAFGFCVGGTLISSALAVMYARGEKPLASLTLLTSLLDFENTGVLDVFIDENHVRLREQTLGQGGLMQGRDMASVFAFLRPNDLVWNYVKTNYLKGEAPPPFDLLFWNADSTNMAGPMYAWYLRNMYLENKLREPGALVICGEQVDLGLIDAPTFIYGSREDHIVPWTSAFASMRLLNPKKPERNRFILGASGHIAGVINPPAKKKRSHWVNDKPITDADTWLETATEKPGSWWDEWAAFLAEHAGKKVKAPTRYGNDEYTPIEPAPGRYVKAKA